MSIQSSEKKRRSKGEGSVFFNEKTQTWISQIELGVDENGKRIRKSVSGKSRTEAIAKTRKLIVDYGSGIVENNVNGKNVIHEKTDLCKFILMYLEVYKKPTVSSKTLENYYYAYEHVERELGNIYIEDLTALKIQQFLNKLASTNKNGKYLSSRTIEGVYGILNQSLNLAVKQKIILSNPIKDGVVKPKTKQIVLKKQKAIPKEICREIFNAISQSPTYKPIITVLFRTGMRISEVMALKWADMDRENHLIHIDRALTHEIEFDENMKPIRRKIVVGNGKTAASQRVVTIGDEVLQVLDEWKLYQSSHIKPSIQAKDFIFSTKDGDIRSYSGFRRQFERYLKSKCLDKYKITFHRFRHTFATMLMEQGVNPKVVQELLGHRDVQTTLSIYTTVTTDHMEMATNKLNDALNDLFKN